METLLLIFISALVTVAAIYDLKSRRIPNRLTYPGMASALIFWTTVGGLDGALFSFSGLIVGMAIFFPFYLMGGMGAGDVKLLGLVGAACGVKEAFIVSLITALTGGVYALGLIAVRWAASGNALASLSFMMRHPVFSEKLNLITSNHEGRYSRLCYGVCIAVGTYIYVVLELTKTNLF